MKIYRLDRTYSKIKRYRQIIGIFIKYGFYDIITKLEIDYYINLSKKLTRQTAPKSIKKMSGSRRLRLAFEELGPTFVKLGQLLSLRPDIISIEYANEFTKLQDEVAPVPFSDVKSIIEKEFEKSINEIFSHFEEQPLAAASIAQAHKAVLKNGKSVAVKVKRPHIDLIIENDINILYDLARLIEKSIPESRQYDPVGIVDEFTKNLRKELDFQHEGRNAELFKKNFDKDPTVFVPQIYWDISTSCVLTMDMIKGIKISDIDKHKDVRLDKKQTAVNGAHAILKQIFEFGFFHADPHPGNLFVLENNVIAPVDYGMMGHIDDDTMEQIYIIVVGVVKKDVNKIIKGLSEMGAVDSSVNTKKLKLDLIEFIEQYYGIPLNRLNISNIISQCLDIFQRHKIQLPSNVVLMSKALVTSEGVCRKLDPEFDMMSILQPYVEEMIIRRMSFRRQGKNLLHLIEDIYDLARILPKDLKDILTKVKTGGISIQFEHRGLSELNKELEKSSNRISFSLIIASLIVGSSLIMQTGVGPKFFNFPLIGIIGYSLAGILGFYLAFSILRSGKL
ncbi:ubiquinone biosynthesis protein UbiB [bacterium]|nr:ubiquinone biosynthesis protein UbiB [bacterium]